MSFIHTCEFYNDARNLEIVCITLHRIYSLTPFFYTSKHWDVRARVLTFTLLDRLTFILLDRQEKEFVFIYVDEKL